MATDWCSLAYKYSLIRSTLHGDERFTYLPLPGDKFHICMQVPPPYWNSTVSPFAACFEPYMGTFWYWKGLKLISNRTWRHAGQFKKIPKKGAPPPWSPLVWKMVNCFYIRNWLIEVVWNQCVACSRVSCRHYQLPYSTLNHNSMILFSTIYI